MIEEHPKLYKAADFEYPVKPKDSTKYVIASCAMKTLNYFC